MVTARFRGREVPSDMSNSSRTKLGVDVRKRLLRGSRVEHRVGALWWTLALVLGSMVVASTAMAAEIVEVRVGRHAEFTRIVFELDRAAGYRIERASPSPGVSELVVSLEATSIPRRIQSTKTLIEQVEVEPTGGRSVARIRLTKSGLKLKEMILASPPRIVLDVLSDAPVVKTAAKPAPAVTPTPATTAKSAAEKPAPVEVAKKVEPKPVEPKKVEPKKVEPKPVEVAKLEPKPVAVPSARAPEGVATAETAAKPVDRTSESSGSSGAMDLLRAREQELAAAGSEPSTSVPMERAQAKAEAQKKAKAKADAERERKKAATTTVKPRPMVAKNSESGGGWMTWALATVGLVVLLAGGFLFMRSRKGGEEVDFEDQEGDPDDAPISFGARSDANPFAGIGDDGDQMTLASPDEKTVPPSPSEAKRGKSGKSGDGETTRVSTPGVRGTGSEPFAFSGAESDAEGDSEEKEMDDMDVISRDAVNESLGGMPPVMGGIPEEFQQMMREMNRRVEALEGRVDELVDARDRLERQVAAQTEELRVQRAAIARTQRAVRNLARPEDEQEATEPALRDPNKPSAEE